ncbi:MAG: diguanylate cyclase domain-containing protein [Desulfobaccales bacterium]
MNFASTDATHLSKPRRFGLLLLVVWTVVVAVSLARNLSRQQEATLKLAHMTAIALYNKDIHYRRWASEFGGVYVPITPTSLPNPHLTRVPERDIQTPSGKRLTLINPAYMNRLVYDLADKDGAPQGHITSLKPLRPKNSPDPWEAAALKAFEQGLSEVSGVQRLNGKDVMRLMRPLMVEKSCLACHAEEGYRVGEVRGGLSISLPMEKLWQEEHATDVALIFNHACLWLLGVVGIVLGVRNLDRANARIITLMHTDALTGLANRRYLADMLEKAMAFASRHEQPLSLIMLDLDDFKIINDSYGHKAGDQVLESFAQLMQNFIRKEDLAARFGGEEFILMLPGTDLEQAAIMAERLRTQMENVTFAFSSSRVTASFGITQYRSGDTFETLINRVDEALYAAKGAGKNRGMRV